MEYLGGREMRWTCEESEKNVEEDKGAGGAFQRRAG